MAVVDYNIEFPIAIWSHPMGKFGSFAEVVDIFRYNCCTKQLATAQHAPDPLHKAARSCSTRTRPATQSNTALLSTHQNCFANQHGTAQHAPKLVHKAAQHCSARTRTASQSSTALLSTHTNCFTKHHSLLNTQQNCFTKQHRLILTQSKASSDIVF